MIIWSKHSAMCLGLRLDFDIGIELASILNQSSIGIGLQYQNHCLDADEIARWNRKELVNTDS